MRVLVVGGGGREHAIICKLNESKKISKLYCAPGNGGTSVFAENVDIKATDIEGILNLVKEKEIDFVVVAPDDPLVLGMVDELEKIGVKAFGPNKAAAIIEGSKVFSKELMKKYKIPTAEYHVFDNSENALSYLKSCTYPVVIKADGLALGKGVIIAQIYEEAVSAINSIMNDRIFGNSGNKIVIEEYLTGPEVSVLAFTDGKSIIPMISSMDHKRVFDGNRGPNTGGMGTIAPNPFYTKDISEACMEKIFLPTVYAMKNENRPFKGCLYFGLMLTKDGPKVIEYNCRFGDPETQVVLPLLETDLMEIFEAVYEERLEEIDIKWNNGAAACVIMASGGYPGKYITGLEISGLDENGQMNDLMIYHAGTKRNEKTSFLTSGGRVLGVTAKGNNKEDALNKAYGGIDKISFSGAHYRRDIGKAYNE